MLEQHVAKKPLEGKHMEEAELEEGAQSHIVAVDCCFGQQLGLGILAFFCIAGRFAPGSPQHLLLFQANS